MVYVIGIIVMFIFVLLSMKKDNARAQVTADHKKKVEECVNFAWNKDLSSNALTVNKRDPVLYDALKIEAAHEVFANYTPDKVIYTGVTVGGVTTGGFDTIKGGYSTSLGKKTGTYYLAYKYGHIGPIGNNQQGYWSDPVSYIVLSDEIKKEAESKPEIMELIDRSTRKSNVIPCFRLSEQTAIRIVDWLSCGVRYYAPYENQKQGAITCSYVCEECGKGFTEWFQKCPNCQAIGKIKTRNK